MLESSFTITMKKINLLYLVLAVGLLASVYYNRSSKNRSIWKKIVFVGDSNTQYGFNSKQGNWLGLLANHLQRTCDVVNRGFSGYNARFVRLILPQIMSEFELEEVAGVVILLGTNDSSEKELQHLSIEQFEQHYQWMLEYLLSFGLDKSQIIIITPPKIFEHLWHTTFFKDSHVKKYVTKCKEIAMRNDITHIDLYELMQSQSNLEPKELLYDGVHLTLKSAELLAAELWMVINRKFIKTRQVIYNYPKFDKIKYKDDLVTLQQHEI